MKTQLVILITTLLLASCKATTHDTNIEQHHPNSRENDNKLESLRYTTFARFGKSEIELNSATLTISEGSNSRNTSFPKKDWDTIIGLVDQIDLEKIPLLKAPTKARLFDGAASASILIVYNSKSVSSSSFDHGRAPKEIEALVNKLLSMAEKNKKP